MKCYCTVQSYPRYKYKFVREHKLSKSNCYFSNLFTCSTNPPAYCSFFDLSNHQPGSDGAKRRESNIEQIWNQMLPFEWRRLCPFESWAILTSFQLRGKNPFLLGEKKNWWIFNYPYFTKKAYLSYWIGKYNVVISGC